MSCKECNKRNEGQTIDKEGITYIRIGNGNVGLLGCREHMLELINIIYPG